ncbi:dGTP triphosphohydrolase [Desulfosporosinus nitroreducens]|uniref:dGTP triphosphohydrolase n=1 Tax=Desulfosporosinus nitroreducens TaxID=2018668 RepID=UPI00207D3829|nr:dNTP triphosphohydrolase [Desulfosporosinus nitroreducens]MCO1601589.1 dNTP triphosphohydrolase [Desulfosporosinus nitroreducens]
MTSFREEQETWERDNLCAAAKRSSDSRRWKVEEPDPYRTEYQRDIGRILYSNCFRRLRMKTQIFKASGSDQHNRTRLTHSLEVSQISRSISRPLKLNVDLTEAIALGHDLGHTPYGHAGEKALQDCLTTMSFNHNVQSAWILRNTLCNRLDLNGKPYPGFNLTYDVVEGVLKHTKCKVLFNELPRIELFNLDEPSSLEGQVVDIADGIAYLKHDIDDGIRNDLITEYEFRKLWDDNTDLPFNNNWIDHLILDVINSSKDKHQITFSPDFEKLHDKIKNFILKNIILSPMVQSRDKEGIEKINAIFHFCMQNPEFILKRNSKVNQYKLEHHGLERVIVDYIQWLGDENADMTYKSIKDNIYHDDQINELDDYFEEKSAM